MADDADQSSAAARAAVGWPLVERRQDDDSPNVTERRRGRGSDQTALLNATPLWPFRLAALAGAVLRAATEIELDSWRLWVCTAIVGAYTTVMCLRPIPYNNDQRTRNRILAEQAIFTAVVLVSGAWASPFVLCLIPTGMLAAFAAGGWFSAQLAAASVVAVTVQHIPSTGVVRGLQDAGLWAGLLLLVAFTSGLAHRAALDGVRQQQLVLDRVTTLSEANSLLFALTRVAQTLPASLDLDEVLDSTVGRVRAMIGFDTLAVYLYNDPQRSFVPIRTSGSQPVEEVRSEALTNGLMLALSAPKTIRIESLIDGKGIVDDSKSGMYAALRARGSLVGLIAIESATAHAFTAQHAEIVHGLAEPFGIAIDNALLFRKIRTLAADEERSRIARDLHDRVGSSLAMIGFEADRALSIATNGEPVVPVLGELREQIRAVVVEVRDTLYDLRAEVSKDRDLAYIAGDFLRRFEQRTGIKATFDPKVEGRVSLPHERELWQILREAMVNVERHSKAKNIAVIVREGPRFALLRITDDGIGYGNAPSRPDSYGIIGMRERATQIGASFSVTAPPGGGTEVRVYLESEGGNEDVSLGSTGR